MSKDETIAGLDLWAERVGELKEFLKTLTLESQESKWALQGALGFMVTACDFLIGNLEAIRNKIRMS